MTGRKEEAYFDQAERLFVREGKTPEQIAEILPVSSNTLYKWKLKGGWGDKRAAALTAPRTLGEKLRGILEDKITDLEAEKGINPASFDAIYKAFCAIDKLEKSQDLRVLATVVMGKYADFLRAPEQQLAAGELQLHGERMRAFFKSLE
jgi:hypothetical protein